MYFSSETTEEKLLCGAEHGTTHGLIFSVPLGTQELGSMVRVGPFQLGYL